MIFRRRSSIVRTLFSNSAAIWPLDLPARIWARTSRWPGVRRSNRRRAIAVRASSAAMLFVPAEGGENRLREGFLRAFRLKKIEAPLLHRLDGRGHVGVRGNDDDRQRRRRLREPLEPLQIAVGAAGKIGQHARRARRHVGLDEFLGGAAGLVGNFQWRDAGGQIALRGRIVGDNENDGSTVHCTRFYMRKDEGQGMNGEE